MNSNSTREWIPYAIGGACVLSLLAVAACVFTGRGLASRPNDAADTNGPTFESPDSVVVQQTSPPPVPPVPLVPLVPPAFFYSAPRVFGPIGPAMPWRPLSRVRAPSGVRSGVRPTPRSRQVTRVEVDVKTRR